MSHNSGPSTVFGSKAFIILNLERYVNDTLKSQCDMIENGYSTKQDCGSLLKLEKDDKVKFKLTGYSYDWSNVLFTYIEGFLAVPL